MPDEKPQEKTHRWTALLLVAIAGAALVTILIIAVPPLLAPADRFASQGDAIKAQNDVRGALLQSVTGLGVLVGVYVTLRQISATRVQLEYTLRTSQAQLASAQQQQQSERLTQSLEHLGHESVSVQIAGIATLELIARDSPDLRSLIAQVLVSYIRTQIPWHPSQDPTVATDNGPFNLLSRAPAAEWALVALGRSVLTGKKDKRLRLNMLDLRGANLEGLQLRVLDFAYSHFEEAFLRDTDLTEAWLYGANLRRADFKDAVLSGACLVQADLRDARHLELADLTGATADFQTAWPAEFDPTASGVILNS